LSEVKAAGTLDEEDQVWEKNLNSYDPAIDGRPNRCWSEPPSSYGSCYPAFKEEPDFMFCDCEPGLTGLYCDVDLCREPTAPKCPSGQVCVGSVDEGFRPDCVLGQKYGYRPDLEDLVTCQAERENEDPEFECENERGPGDYIVLTNAGAGPRRCACLRPRLVTRRGSRTYLRTTARFGARIRWWLGVTAR